MIAMQSISNLLAWNNTNLSSYFSVVQKSNGVSLGCNNVLVGLFLLETPGESPHPCLFQHIRGCLHSLAGGPLAPPSKPLSPFLLLSHLWHSQENSMFKNSWLNWAHLDNSAYSPRIKVLNLNHFCKLFSLCKEHKCEHIYVFTMWKGT